MPISSYQVQWLLTRLRRLAGGTPQRPTPAGPSPERVQLSELASRWAREAQAQRAPQPRPEVWPLDLSEVTPRAPVVRFEMERRAGSFMRPKPQPASAPPPIPKMKR